MSTTLQIPGAIDVPEQNSYTYIVLLDPNQTFLCSSLGLVLD
ncbi:uncharacterized protein ANIA_11515 [Aspergillus nidulans FGSC A4]|uniref:Uncharacterized protein n=1 Tax=Emericella nidulans (strain FGSC A4 / ATCC 38163 / CBS 112.46 / NRRL 194 / M139) TaxID=227321 RepID=C8V054_EMENI|nr:hypothetical protein [Aspergillus nidulans FGSC A4]CBF69390.1 TPA: hypothetical protein ANIA_11515 [Aspergillus nidulans FGSC A4]